LQQNFARDYKNEVFLSFKDYYQRNVAGSKCGSATQAIDSHKNGRRFHKFWNDRNTCWKFQSPAPVTKEYLGPKGALLQYALFFIFTVVSLPVFTTFNTLEQILTSNRRKLSTM